MRWLLIVFMILVGPPGPAWDEPIVPMALADDDDDDDDDDNTGSGGFGGGGAASTGRSSDGGGSSAVRGVPDGGAALRRLFDRLLGPAVVEGGDVVAREIIALGLSNADLAALARLGFTRVGSNALGAFGETLHRLRVPEEISLPDALAAARAAAPGAALDFNHLYPTGGDACAGSSCWSATLVRLADYRPDACGRGAPIAVSDTRVDARHPALKGATISQRRFLPDGLTAAPPDHGTAVAALLVGRVAAGAPPLAPGARLLVAEVFGVRDGTSRADAAAVVRGLDWAVASRARVIGLSLAGARNVLLDRALTLAARQANLVAAAGNEGARAGPVWPAAHPDVIAVVAVDARKRAWRGGNRGEHVELAAPGVDVLSASPGGGVTGWTGTSFAVPFAVAAVLRARAETGGDPVAARALLVRTAEDLGARGRDDVTGNGLVRAPGNRCWWVSHRTPRLDWVGLAAQLRLSLLVSRNTPAPRRDSCRGFLE